MIEEKEATAMTAFPQILARTRRQHDMTQDDLARRLNLSF